MKMMKTAKMGKAMMPKATAKKPAKVAVKKAVVVKPSKKMY